MGIAILKKMEVQKNLQGLSNALARELNLSQTLIIDNTKVTPSILWDLTVGAIVTLKRVDAYNKSYTHYVFKNYVYGIIDSMWPGRPSASQYTESQYEILNWSEPTPCTAPIPCSEPTHRSEPNNSFEFFLNR